MKRKQLNIRIPQSHINRINELRGDLTQSELVMRLVDEEWGRKSKTMDAQFTLYGLDYSFTFDPRQDNPAEGPTLTYVGDENGRLAPSKHAHEDAWQYAEALLCGKEVHIPFVKRYPQEQEALAQRVFADMQAKGVPVQHIDGVFDLSKYNFDQNY